MTSIEIARYKAYSLALAHLTDNLALTKEVPAFEQTCQEAKQLLADIDNLNTRRSVKLDGVTVKKRQQRDELVQQALAISSVISGYAVRQKDKGLAEGMRFSTSELRYAAELRLVDYCTSILNKATELGAELAPYGIGEEMLNQFRTQLTAFSTTQLQPRNRLAERKDSRQQVTEKLKELGELFTRRIDAMMLLFQQSQREFYGQYIAKRTVVNPGHRSTRIEGTITAGAGAQPARVKITVAGTDFTTFSNADGSYVLKTPLLPSVKVVYEREGYKTITLELPIRRGQATVQDVQLEAA